MGTTKHAIEAHRLTHHCGSVCRRLQWVATHSDDHIRTMPCTRAWAPRGPRTTANIDTRMPMHACSRQDSSSLYGQSVFRTGHVRFDAGNGRVRSPRGLGDSHGKHSRGARTSTRASARSGTTRDGLSLGRRHERGRSTRLDSTQQGKWPLHCTPEAGAGCPRRAYSRAGQAQQAQSRTKFAPHTHTTERQEAHAVEKSDLPSSDWLLRAKH